MKSLTSWSRFLLPIILLSVLKVCAIAAVPVPLVGATPVALDRVRIANPAVLPLAGIWKFKLIHGSITAKGFQSGDIGPATASSVQQGHSPLNALNGSSIPWTASDASMPQWWQVDFGKLEDVVGLALAWEFKEATYQFKAEGSRDGQTWALLSDQTGPPGGHNGPVAIPRSRIRFLRITIVGAERPNGVTWASLREVHITVFRDGREVHWMPSAPRPEDPKQRDGFARTDMSDHNWSNIPVPANWEMEGFSIPTYDNPDEAVGLYRRWIDVPASFSGKRVLWHFDGVFDGAEIFVNGKQVAYHESGFTAFDVDVTAQLKPGTRNLLALRISKNTPSVDLDTGDFWSLGGIYRENYLVALPTTHVQDITVVTDLDPTYHDATLNATVSVAGAPGAKIAVKGRLFKKGGQFVPGVMLTGKAIVNADGTANLQLQTSVKAPALWSAEKPNLYYLVLTLANGSKVIEHIQERFGFRKIEIRNGVVLWNGVPIKCTGSCRHEEWAAYGHALNETAWRTDLTLMKGCNINAIRTSHYNHAARFLELCDEMGMYVLDEVPACWCDVKDPALKAAFVLRTRETLARDKNRPCVLAWSLSNESGYGPNVQAMLDYALTTDPTRPAFISQCGPWNNPKISFQDTHYPDINDVKRMATEDLRKKTPLVMTEQPHIFYVSDGLTYDYGEKDLWGQVLARNWNVVWPTDSIVGSFIWEWQDQGIADKFPGRQGVDSEGLRENNHKGIVDGYRHVKPEYWNVKMVYSPVVTTAREIEPDEDHYVVPLQNRFSFTDLSELTCRWQALAAGKLLASGDQKITCAPRSSVEATFPVTAGMDTLRIEFIHPDGRSLYAARLHVKGTALPSPPVPLATHVTLNTDEAHQMLSWTLPGQNLSFQGPFLNLGEQRQNHGDHDARNFVASKEAPLLKNVKAETKSTGNGVDISVTADVYLVESPERKAQLTYTLSHHTESPDDLTWKLTWLAEDANLWELGVTFLFPASVDHMAWSRNGLWTEYPRDHIGANDGVATSKDLTFRCTKRDARWVWMTGANGPGFAAYQSDSPLHVRGKVVPEGTLLFLSTAVSVPYDFSTGLAPDLLIHVKKGQTYTGGFQLGITQSTP